MDQMTNACLALHESLEYDFVAAVRTWPETEVVLFGAMDQHTAQMRCRNGVHSSSGSVRSCFHRRMRWKGAPLARERPVFATRRSLAVRRWPLVARGPKALYSAGRCGRVR